MGYEPLLIADFKTGLQSDKQPWLVQDDAQTEIFDAYVRDGVIHKRDGYNYYADGGKGDSAYCESRIVRQQTKNMTGVVDGANQTFTTTIGASNRPLRRGGFVVTSDTPSQTLTDDGLGAFSGDGTGTINYTTGVVSVTFTTAPTAPDPIVATYDYHPGLPVMMVANFVTADNTQELIVADEDFLNRYNSTTNRLDDITARVYTGDNSNFFDWVQYPKTTDEPRLLFTNNVDPIQSYDGTTVTDFLPYFSTDTPIAAEAFDTGDGTVGPYSNTVSSPPILPGSITINEAGGQAVTDDGDGNLTGDGTGTVNYYTGLVSVTFTGVVASMDAITIDYTPVDEYVQTCLHMANYKDRLLLFRTTETNGTIYPQRIRISGIGQSGDDFRTTTTGAGIIDIPDQYWITGVTFNRDDIIIFTQRSTWLLKYTGNDIVPFSLDRIDESRGNLAPFSPINYLGLSKGYSPKGMIVTDGYQVKRNDDLIPDYTFEEISQENFDLCFSGDVDDEDVHYLIHPSPEAEESDRILVQNYMDGNFSVYRIGLSCMGLYRESFGVTWNDLLLEFPDQADPDGRSPWDEFAQKYTTWNDISYVEDMPISIGGGHKGEIWRLNKDEGEDNPVRIRGLTIDETATLVLDVTTDWNNYKEGDYIYFTGVDGADEVNGKMGFIPVGGVTDEQHFKVKFPAGNPPTISTYTANSGTVSRVIPFEIKTKNFNPYVSNDAKVRCGYLYVRADTTSTLLTDRDDNEQEAFLVVDVYGNDYINDPIKINSLNIDFEGDISNRGDRTSTKRWNKMFINLTADFIKFGISNTQPGTRVRIHALRLGVRPTGRTL